MQHPILTGMIGRSVIGWAGLMALASCHPRSEDPRATSIPVHATGAAQATPPRDAPQCGPGPTPETAPHAVTGAIPAWRASLGQGTGALGLDVAGGLVVARLQGGKSVSVDLETGALCATLVEAPLGARPAASIDPYTARSAVVNGALLGGNGLHVAAVELRTGELLWRRQLVGVAGDDRDDLALRDGMQAVGVSAVDVLGFHARHRDGDRFRFEEMVIGVDPATGAERWRRPIVQHAWNKPLGVGGEMRLSTDGRRALVETPDRLMALEGSAGAEVWSVPWTRAPGLRVFTGGGRVLVVTAGARLALRDASDGKLVAEMRAPGREVTGAIVRRDAVIVTVENAPGAASVAALDASGRVRWKRDVAYSVVQLRALDGGEQPALYVLDGSGRLVALDERTGAEGGGISVGFPSDFGLARTRAGVTRVVVPLDGLAAFDLTPGSRPKALDAFLRWHVEEKVAADGQSFCHPSAVSWVDGEEKVLWTRALPAWMRASPWGLCRDHEISGYLRRPRHAGGLLYATIGVEAVGDAVVIAADRGVLALRRSDGAPLLERAAHLDDRAFFFDAGTFLLDAAPPCSGPAVRARVFARCGSSLIYFNGSTALSIDSRAWRVEAESRLDRGKATGGHEASARVQLGARTLTLRGVTYMH